MGGGGFSMEPDNPLLDDHVLELARANRGRDRAACLFRRHRERGFARLHRLVLRRLRPPIRSEPPPVVHPDDRRHRRLPARPGCRLRRRRQHREHARGLAHPWCRPRLADGVGVGGRDDRLVGWIALLVRIRDDRLVRTRPGRPVRRSRVRAREPRPALRRRGETAAGLPPARRRRLDPRRLRCRRRRRAGLPRHGSGRGGRLAAGCPRLPRRARTGRLRRSRRRCRRATWAERSAPAAAATRYLA